MSLFALARRVRLVGVLAGVFGLLFLGETPASAQMDGVLAGQVQAEYSFIFCEPTPMCGFAQPKAFQINIVDTLDERIVATLLTTDGRFLVQGLKAGRTYQVLARAKLDKQVFTASVLVTPPQLLLQIDLPENKEAKVLKHSPSAAQSTAFVWTWQDDQGNQVQQLRQAVAEHEEHLHKLKDALEKLPPEKDNRYPLSSDPYWQSLPRSQGFGQYGIWGKGY